MKDMKKLCEVIEQELHKIAEKGLTTSNVDTAYKLVDMYKDLKNTDYWETKVNTTWRFLMRCRVDIQKVITQ